ncbi:MAG TPA: MoaD/ThiS family protein [Gemmatimonadales bacterium]|jgi:molybdopterin synthase catalytic subunit
MTASISVTCRFFGRYAEAVGRETVTMALPVGSSVSGVVRHVRRELAGGDRLPPDPLAAVNRVHAFADHPVEDGDEVAFLPPLAGG